MKLNVKIEYRTSWGEELVLRIGSKSYPLSYSENGLWSGEVEIKSLKTGTEYSYQVVRDGQTIRTEWKSHVLTLPEGVSPKVVMINDRWNDRHGWYLLHHSPC